MYIPLGKRKCKGVQMSSDLVSEEANTKYILCSPWVLWTEYLCPPQKIYIEILILKVMVLEDEASGRA